MEIMDKKKRLLDMLFNDSSENEQDDNEQDDSEMEDIPTDYEDEDKSILDLLTESPKDKIDRMVKENKNHNGRKMEAENDLKRGKQFLDSENKMKALDDLQGVEIKEIKIIKPKKKKEDEIYKPVMVHGGF